MFHSRAIRYLLVNLAVAVLAATLALCPSKASADSISEVQSKSFISPISAAKTLESLMNYSPVLKTWVNAVWNKYSLDKSWIDDNGGEQKVWAYADRHSISPGEALTIFLSVKPGSGDVNGFLRISRLSGQGNKPLEELVLLTEARTIGSQIVRPEASIIGAGWTNGVKIDATRGWKSGFYVADFVYSNGKTEPNAVSFVVKPQVKQGDILVKIETNTLQAYNFWGGFSLYKSFTDGDYSSMVSFDRPTHLYTDHDPFFSIPWLETYAQARGLKLDYISDFDLSTDPTVLDGYKLFVAGGHDEYWTKEMYDAVENRIFVKGRNVLFLGANTAYWQVRYVDVNQSPNGPFMGRQMICYKTYRNVTDPIAQRFAKPADALLWATGLFRLASRRPESMLIGIAYQNWFEWEKPGYDYSVVNADLPFFQDTGLKAGDKLAGLVGYEWDNRDPDGDGNQLWDVAKSLNKRIPPESIRVLFDSNPVGADHKPGKAESVYWESPAGAKVFSSGTVWWSRGMTKPGVATPQLDLLNKNLFDYMLK